MLVDDEPAPILHIDTVVASVFVDNFGAEGTNPDMVRGFYSRALRAVVEKGLDV